MSAQETATETGTFSNENINVNVTKKPHCQVKFEVTVQPQAAQAAYVKAIKNVKKEVSVPGFRKGKAPDHLVLTNYSSAIQKEFVDVVLQTAFNEALHLTHISPFKEGHMKRPVVQECSKEKGAKFTIEFEVKPHVPSIDLNDIKIDKPTFAPVTDKEKQNALHRIALQFTTYDPLEDQSVKEDDFVDLDVDILEDNQPERHIIKNQRTQVSDDGLPPWIREKIIGLKVGESAEGNTEEDPNQTRPDFKSVPFRVTVKGLWKGHMPPFDDALAQKVGLQSFEELQTKIAEKLEKEAKDEHTEKEIELLDNLLLNKFPIDLPLSLIERNKEARLQNYLDKLADQSDQEFSTTQLKQIERSIETNTIHQLQLLFLLRKAAADYEIEVNANDINEELSRQIALVSTGRSPLDFQGDKDMVREQLYGLALDRKIKKFLLDKATSAEG